MAISSLSLWDDYFTTVSVLVLDTTFNSRPVCGEHGRVYEYLDGRLLVLEYEHHTYLFLV